MDQQLARLSKTLEEHGVNYWLNAGTLLGIVRDQCLISSDRDMDIGIWDEEVPKALSAIQRLADAGYGQMSTRSYEGNICKIKIKPTSENGSRLVDIDVYRRSGDFAWCPQPVSRAGQRVLGLRSVKTVYNALSRFIRRWQNNGMGGARVSPMLYQVHTWWIPRHYFEDVVSIELDGCRMLVPRESESYLEYRYGNWRVPQPGWNALADDPTLVRTPPAQLRAKAA